MPPQKKFLFKAATIKILKRIKKSRNNSLIIRKQYDSVSYALVPVTHDELKDSHLIGLLAFWRKRHESWFPAQFPVTLQGTKKWLKAKVLDEPDRLLFMLRVKNQYIGHIGLYRFDFLKKTCEIDNIIRGKKIYPGIMEQAIHEMMVWGKEILGVKRYALETTSDNTKALNLYYRLHFSETKRIPLIRVKKDDRIEWQEAPKRYSGTIARYTVFMEEDYEKI